MGLKINQSLVNDEVASKLVELCPFKAISYNNDKLDINAGCKLCKMCVRNSDGVITFEEDKIETAKISMPCLLCIDSDVNTPRLPSYKRKSQFKECDEIIKVITFNDVEDQDENHYGLKGSATQVEKIFEPEKRHDKEIFTDGDLSKTVYDLLKDGKFI